MGYILKDTQGLVVTRLTDVGRRKISQGNFNISYFQIGDSEVSYDNVNSDNFYNSMVLEPSYNSQNNLGVPQSTKNDIKYPYYFQGTSGSTYGIPYQSSIVEEVYNTASSTGFFTVTGDCYQMIQNGVCYNSQYSALLSSFNGNASLSLSNSPCNDSSTNTISAGTKVAVKVTSGTAGTANCYQPDPITGEQFCMSPCQPTLFYNVVNFVGNTLTLDRPLPDFDNSSLVMPLFSARSARLFFYLSGAASYDLTTPMLYDTTSVINYESVCYPTDGFVRVWNMNIPWSESPAGSSSYNFTYEDFASKDYLGLKEYYGYQNSNGQVDTSGTWYYNSFGERIDVTPEEQKVISIVHYSNSSIINWYGEKFACEVYDPTNPGGTGQARNFEISIPWLSWHKNKTCCGSQNTTNQIPTTFYIDPPGFDKFNLLQPYYIQSSKNSDMNNPGIRYYHLYDSNPAYTDGPPNRVGKVFPDDKIIIFDDEEIIVALSYVSNRSWTLPAPKLGTVIPGTCEGSSDGILNDDTECLWVTYLFRPPLKGGPQGMHCNYYQKICGPTTDCGPTEQNVTVTFGGDFECMTQNLPYGWWAGEFWVLAQKTNTTSRPDPASWVAIDFTQVLSDNGYIDGDGYIAPSGMTSLNFTISQTNYDSGTPYELINQIELAIPDAPNEYSMNFGDETFFNGVINTDIQATIYEMRYSISLADNQFVNSSNPTWSEGDNTYMTEVGLYDNDKNLLALGKFQSPQLRKGTQQVVIKLDF